MLSFVPRRTAAALGGFVLIWALSACSATPSEEAATEAELGETSAAIVNGSREYGWEGVGALTLDWGGWYGYAGSFCTATLIDQEWLLTAAHCLDEHEGQQVSPGSVYFYVGNDAQPSGWNDPPSSGQLYATQSFHIHPRYSGESYGNDIALVHLSQRVNGVDIYPMNFATFTSSFIGDETFYVGFGATEGVNSTGGGLKRSTTMNIASFSDSAFSCEWGGSSVCFGDSGGPGFRQFGSEWRVVGVNSTVASGGQDPCRNGYTNHTRVDAYQGWIESVMSGITPDCRDAPSLCQCADACQANGYCNDSVCGTMSCEGLYGCIVRCPAADGSCRQGCTDQATDAALELFESLQSCFYYRCGQYEGDAFQECAVTQCETEYEACFPIPTGEEACPQVYACIAGCGSDMACERVCLGQGTADAQVAVTEMIECWDDNCSHLYGTPGYNDCTYEQCTAEVEACWPPAGCDVMGGDCDAGRACYYTASGTTDCFYSDDLEAGETCDPEQEARRPCADGLICAEGTTGFICAPLCLSDSECSGGAKCEKPVDPAHSSLGACLCADRDGDGFCFPLDCDDTRPDMNPGQPEACGDNRDNDCDGTVDEGCSSCTDADGDHYCVENGDCDDTRNTIYPGAEEVCDDGLDNDCDGRTDEGCSSCVDEDDDGFCAHNECDDSDPDVNPRAAEVCDDGVDNDCDGHTDEGCGGECTDLDQDGHCAETDDCDDTRPSVYAGAPEVCDNDFDDNCNGQTDEGCGTCTDLDQDGHCAETDDCDDTRPSVYAGAPEVCDNNFDDDCDGLKDEDCGTCTDLDQDGRCAETDDCDDTRPSVHADAPEVCDNNFDDNCNGQVDEGCGGVCTDLDDDGFCAESGDCDDARPGVNPGVQESCGNSFDDDCDGQTDEDCGGPCTDLDQDGYCLETGDCDDTRPSVYVGAPEVCGNSFDDDCDGQIDEDCPAECRDYELCADGRDNDCDGEVDENDCVGAGGGDGGGGGCTAGSSNDGSALLALLLALLGGGQLLRRRRHLAGAGDPR